MSEEKKTFSAGLTPYGRAVGEMLFLPILEDVDGVVNTFGVAGSLVPKRPGDNDVVFAIYHSNGEVEYGQVKLGIYTPSSERHKDEKDLVAGLLMLIKHKLPVELPDDNSAVEIMLSEESTGLLRPEEPTPGVSTVSLKLRKIPDCKSPHKDKGMYFEGVVRQGKYNPFPLRLPTTEHRDLVVTGPLQTHDLSGLGRRPWNLEDTQVFVEVEDKENRTDTFMVKFPFPTHNWTKNERLALVLQNLRQLNKAGEQSYVTASILTVEGGLAGGIPIHSWLIFGIENLVEDNGIRTVSGEQNEAEECFDGVLRDAATGEERGVSVYCGRVGDASVTILNGADSMSSFMPGDSAIELQVHRPSGDSLFVSVGVDSAVHLNGVKEDTHENYALVVGTAIKQLLDFLEEFSIPVVAVSAHLRQGQEGGLLKVTPPLKRGPANDMAPLGKALADADLSLGDAYEETTVVRGPQPLWIYGQGAEEIFHRINPGKDMLQLPLTGMTNLGPRAVIDEWKPGNTTTVVAILTGSGVHHIRVDVLPLADHPSASPTSVKRAAAMAVLKHAAFGWSVGVSALAYTYTDNEEQADGGEPV